MTKDEARIVLAKLLLSDMEPQSTGLQHWRRLPDGIGINTCKDALLTLGAQIHGTNIAVTTPISSIPLIVLGTNFVSEYVLNYTTLIAFVKEISDE